VLGKQLYNEGEKEMKNWKSLLTGCIIGLVTSSSALFAVPARILVIRHGEPPPQGNSLSQKGRERAGALPFYFMETPDLIKFGLPVAIFAMNPSNADPSMREIETITPLANALHIPVQTQYPIKEEEALAAYILADQQCNGKTVVICWEHTLIADLVYHLGINPIPNAYPGTRFDLTWDITYENPTAPKLHVRLQELMYDDSSLPFIPFASQSGS
jgi:hypothetical protein